VQNRIKSVHNPGKAGDYKRRLHLLPGRYLEECHPHPVQKKDLHVVHTPRRNNRKIS